MLSREQIAGTLKKVSRAETMPEYIDSEFIDKIMTPWQVQQPKPEEFTDVYSRDEISQDLQTLKKRRQTFSGTKSEIGNIGQFVVAEGIFNNGWMPAVDRVIPASRYDDVFRGTDFVFRFLGEGEENYYLAVDVKTIGSREVILSEVRQIKESLKKGQSVNLKYFDDGYVKGKISAPKIVLGFNPGYASVVQKILLKTKEERQPSEKIDNEVIKNIMNLEILAQLMDMESFFEAEDLSGALYDIIHEKYQKILEAFIKDTDINALMGFLENLLEASKVVGDEKLNESYEGFDQTIVKYRKLNPGFKY
jgi:hypothetical protein